MILCVAYGQDIGESAQGTSSVDTDLLTTLPGLESQRPCSAVTVHDKLCVTSLNSCHQVTHSNLAVLGLLTRIKSLDSVYEGEGGAAVAAPDGSLSFVVIYQVERRALDVGDLAVLLDASSNDLERVACTVRVRTGSALRTAQLLDGCSHDACGQFVRVTADLCVGWRGIGSSACGPRALASASNRTCSGWGVLP